jgi:hypothetical protein
VFAASTPEITSDATPPSAPATTGAAVAPVGADGGSYAHAVVRTAVSEEPTAFTATASYERCSPFGALIGGQMPCGVHTATRWPAWRTSNPVSAG